MITNAADVHRRIAFQQNAEGAGLSPFESWLLLRGIKTLSLRCERQNISANSVAEFLCAHPSVKAVYYPGLSGHIGHALHRSQSTGDGSVISFTAANPQFAQALVSNVRLFAIAVSFGSVNSVISVPFAMSHASIPDSLKQILAPPPNLIRLSMGIENVDDLIEDLDQALTAAARKTTVGTVELQKPA